MEEFVLPTLDEFINHCKGHPGWPSNSWVREPGFKDLYLRVTQRYLLERKWNVIDVANCNVEHEGQGTFKRLIIRLKTDYPTFGIYLENVHNERLREGLPRMGFTDVGRHPASPCFFMQPSVES